MAKKATQHQGAQLSETLYYPSDLLSNNSYGFYMLFFIYIREPVKEINSYSIADNKIAWGSSSYNPLNTLYEPPPTTSGSQGRALARANNQAGPPIGTNQPAKSNKPPPPKQSKAFYQAELEAAGTNPLHRRVRNDLNAATGKKWYVLKQSIALPLITFPQNIKHDWGQEELGFTGFAYKRFAELFRNKHEFQSAYALNNIEGLQAALAADQSGGNAIIDTFTKGGKYLARKLGDKVGVDASTTFNRSINASENTQLETSFTATGPRGSTFDFSFYPRNREEAINVYKIIRTFKFYAAPHFHNQGKGFYQDYPSEFSMALMYRSHEGTYLAKWGRFVITTINQTLQNFPDNLFHPDNNNAFADDSFIYNPTMSIVPTKIDISMEISELEIMDKERITQGF